MPVSRSLICVGSILSGCHTRDSRDKAEMDSSSAYGTSNESIKLKIIFQQKLGWSLDLGDMMIYFSESWDTRASIS